MQIEQALSHIRLIPDYPKPGILFRDITPLLGNAGAFSTVIAALSETDEPFTHVAGLEARGFILGAAIASHTKTGFIPLRKSGKLPYTTHARSYDLEYGKATLEAHIDAATTNDSVLLVDDVLATGGTALAGLQLIRDLGAQCSEVVFLLEIEALGGREKIAQEFPDVALRSLVKA